MSKFTVDLEEFMNAEDPTARKYKGAPGPGTYSTFYGSIAHNVMKQQQAKSIMGRNFVKSSTDYLNKAGPGPAAYNPSKWAHGRTFSMGGKTNKKATDTAVVFPGPGPGEYPVRGDMSKGVLSPSFKSRVRVSDPRFCLVSPGAENIPGPGTYKLPVERSPRAYTVKGRLHDKMKTTPGPGQYTPRPPSDGPEFSLGGKLTYGGALGNNADASLPGPGAYHIRSACFDAGEQSTQMTGPGPSFGSRPIEPPPKSTLGPGQYETRKPIGSDARAFALKSRPKDPKTNSDVPGPGYYQTQEDTHKVMNVTFKGKTKTPKPPQYPGPGQYDQSPTFGKSGRMAAIHGKVTATSCFPFEMSSPRKGKNADEEPVKLPPSHPSNLPGPGHYSPKETVADKVSGGPLMVAPINSVSKKSNDLGPGEYPLPSSFDGTTARITMKGRLNDGGGLGVSTNYPGPGAYDTENFNGCGTSKVGAVMSPRQRY